MPHLPHLDAQAPAAGVTGSTRGPRTADRGARLGVMGGTFDPIHQGHLILAEQARDQLGLNQVLFVPAGQPWRKAGRKIAPVEQRVAMTRAAIAGDPHFALSLVEAERTGPSYTVETLAALLQEYGPQAQLWFITGQDALADLPHWRNPAGIVRLARLAVAARPGWDLAVPRALLDMVPDVAAAIDRINMPQVDISSTDIRRRIAANHSIRYLVPEAVAKHIEQEGLYESLASNEQ